MAHNALHSLGLLHFQPLGQLEWLNVSNNLISSLEVDSFAGLASLTVLDLSANRLSRLTPGLFSEMPALAHLDLSRNKIQTVNLGAFDSLTRLHTLRLEDNNLNHVPSAALAAVSATLHSLRLSRNVIDTLEDGCFRNLAHLRRLDLNDNALIRIHPAAFDGLTDLEALDLSFNRLDGTVDGLPVSLKHLDLSGNMWRTLPSSFLSGLNQLETLNVSYAEYLRRVEPDAFHLAGRNGSTPQVLPLVNLVMTNNALWNQFPSTLLHGLESHLVRLDLSGNAFETLTLTLIEEPDGWPNLRYLNVAYNPLECNCSLQWLWKMLQQHRVNLSNSPSNEESDGPLLTVVNVTCIGPAAHSGLPLSGLTHEELHCSAFLSASITALLAVAWLALTAGLVALAVFYWHRRRRRRKSNGLRIVENGLMNKTSHHYHLAGGSSNNKQPLLVGEVVIPASPAPSSSIPHYYPHHHHHHHHLHPSQHHMVTGRDEYTYHCAGTIKRIPVTVV